MLTAKSHSREKNINIAKQYNANPTIIVDNNNYEINAFKFDPTNVKIDGNTNKVSVHNFYPKCDYCVKYSTKHDKLEYSEN